MSVEFTTDKGFSVHLYCCKKAHGILGRGLGALWAIGVKAEASAGSLTKCFNKYGFDRNHIYFKNEYITIQIYCPLDVTNAITYLLFMVILLLSYLGPLSDVYW